MTRTTGATDAQIEAAAYQYLQTCGPVEPDVYAEADQIVRHVAFGLVRTDHRIVRVDDLRAIEGAVDWRRQPWRIREAFNRLQAAIGEAE